MFIKRILLGRPLKTNEASEQRLSKTKALAILASDALSSIAYGPEQILLVLMTVSVLAYWYSIPIAVGVVILLLALVFSYRQVIFAYPKGGGAYVVASENLGSKVGLFAGGALLVDYILTVAVSVCAGVDAVTSAVPVLHEHQVSIAISLVILLTLANLRGVSESASFFAYPVYLFVLAMVILIIHGLYEFMTGQVDPSSHTALGTPVAGISLFILLKAFASGSSALTGVEAISNSISNFKEPSPHNAAKTLLVMGALLAFLFTGIVTLTYLYGVTPSGAETVISQLAVANFGRGTLYYVIQIMTALILVLAANTGYTAFPLLAVNLSKDRYLPTIFQNRGDRLSYSNGIIFLSIVAIVLIIVFNGSTEALIPLYALGVFIPFTLAQFGMMVKWWRERSYQWIRKFVVNAVGMVISLVVALMFVLTKFPQVWPIFLFLPVIVFVLMKIHQHYELVGEQIVQCEQLAGIEGHVMIIPVSGMTQVVANSIRYAKSFQPKRIIAVYVAFDEEQGERFEELWAVQMPDVRLVVLYSPYRSLTQPLLKWLDKVTKKSQQQGYEVTVIIPQIIPKKVWHYLLHNQSGLLIRSLLYYRRDIAVITIPYHLKK